MSKHNSRPEISDELIGDYLDGRLDPEQAARLRAAIDSDPRLAARVAAYQAQDSGLKQLADSVLEEPVPDRLRRILEGSSRRRPKDTLNADLVTALVLGAAIALAADALNTRSADDPPGPAGASVPSARLSSHI